MGPAAAAWVLWLTFTPADSGRALADEPPAADAALFERGRAVFRRCEGCHIVDRPDHERRGPHLYGLFGRRAGSVDGYRFSRAMRESEVIWTQESLRAFLTEVRRFIPGNRMSAPGIRDEDDLDALLHYLREAGATTDE